MSVPATALPAPASHWIAVNGLGADSLDFVDLIFAIEKRFGIRLRDDKLDRR